MIAGGSSRAGPGWFAGLPSSAWPLVRVWAPAGGASWYGSSARTVRRIMTDTPPWGAGGAGDQEQDQGQGKGQRQDQGQPQQPWFPPGSQPGEYGQPPPGTGYGPPPGSGYG